MYKLFGATFVNLIKNVKHVGSTEFPSCQDWQLNL